MSTQDERLKLRDFVVQLSLWLALTIAGAIIPGEIGLLFLGVATGLAVGTSLSLLRWHRD